MNIVLGVSMTPTTVRMVLVEGEKADGATVDHDVFDITGTEDAAISNASEQVIAAILGTRESAASGSHRLLATGVTWSDHAEAAALREALAARGIEDVTLVSELHAAGALAQAAGGVVGHAKTALLFIERDTATVSVVDVSDGSIVKVHSRNLHSADALAVLTDMAASLEEDPAPPDGIFLLGSGVDVSSVKDHLKDHLTIPVSAPEEPEMALARGAALASANAPEFDASTVGLAYSQDPDGTTAGQAYPGGLGAITLAGSDGSSMDDADLGFYAPERHDRGKPFLLAGSSLTAIFVVGVVALVISLAVSIRPTVDARPSPVAGTVGGNAALPPPAAAQNAPALAPPPLPPPVAAPPTAPPPTAETIPEPVPMVQQQPAPRAMVPAAPDARPPAPLPAAPPYAPVGVPSAPGYAPAPAAPAVPILPPFIELGPGPSYQEPDRGYDPRWYPPQQQWRGWGGPGHRGRPPLWLWPGA